MLFLTVDDLRFHCPVGGWICNIPEVSEAFHFITHITTFIAAKGLNYILEYYMQAGTVEASGMCLNNLILCAIL
jgi:hypothetical protein